MLAAYCFDQTQKESPILLALRSYTQSHFQSHEMLSDLLVGRLLQFCVRMLSAKNVLDIGTYTGYSALSMAEALPDDGIVTTCDKDLRILAIARQFFDQSPHSCKIKVFEGEASQCIQTIQAPIDLAFIDADKMKTDEYFEATLTKLRVGGLIIVDDVLWRGEVLKPIDKRARALHAFNQKIATDSRITNVLLPIRHGLNMIAKL